MNELAVILQRWKLLSPPSRKIVLICPNQSTAGQLQVEAGEMFRQHGAQPVGPGLWELSGAIFQFANAQSDLMLLRQQLQGATVLVMTRPEELDAANPYVVALLQTLLQRGQAFLIVPH